MKYVNKHKGVTLQGTPNELLEDFNTPLKLNSLNMLNMSMTKDSPSAREFCGGTLKEVKTPPDMTVFRKTLSDLLENPDLKVLRPGVSVTVARRRVKSEYDGDYDLDKRWDTKPFNNTERSDVTMPHITILANMSVYARYSSDQISEYGALIWAIIQFLESRGIRVSVRSVFHSVQSKDFTATVDIDVKTSTKYTSPEAIAHVFTSNYIRRVMFKGLLSACEHGKLTADDGLGQPIMEKTPVKYSDGILTLGIGALNRYTEVSNELTKLMKGIGR